MSRRGRKPRDICASIIADRLEVIEARGKRGPLTTDETDFVVAAYKSFADAEHTDAEVEYLTTLTPKESNALEDAIARVIDIEPEPKALP